VGANWRVTLRFAGPDAFDVDYVDYHQGGRTMPMKNSPHPGSFVLRQFQ